jgi:hypothetical protein
MYVCTRTGIVGVDSDYSRLKNRHWSRQLLVYTTDYSQPLITLISTVKYTSSSFAAKIRVNVLKQRHYSLVLNTCYRNK